MAENNIRIGRISSINYKKGTIKVVYPDKSNAVTTELPVLNFCGEYKMPGIGEKVLVLHLSNGTSAGVVLGTFWSGANLPLDAGKGIYKKEYAAEKGKAYSRYDEATNDLIFKAGNIKFQTSSGETTIEEMIKRLG